MSPAMEKARIDHQVLTPIFSGTGPDRNPLAEYHIHLAAFFCISVPNALRDALENILKNFGSKYQITFA